MLRLDAGWAENAYMRILLLNQYAGSPSHGMEFRPHWMAREWLAAGHEVLVIAGSYSHLRHRNFRASYRKPVLIDDIPFIVLWAPKHNGNGVLRLLGMIFFGLQLRFLRLKLIKWKPTVVVASSTHPFDVRPGYQIARAARARLVFEVHDLWPQTPMHVGGLSAKHPVVALMQREEDFACSHADWVVSILPKTESYLQSRGLPPGKWSFIPNGADLTLQLTQEERDLANQITSEARGDGQFLIAYLGGFATSNALDQLLEAMEKLARKDVRLLLVGDGGEKTKLKTKFGEVSGISWHSRVTPSVARAVMERCDALYYGVLDSPLYALS
ncbi:MAG: glycosyltransferase WbuB, partial [Proteobacteria bacterium]|nr:glycosyltransferase WbuB [Pseudomonadota bacterium]